MNAAPGGARHNTLSSMQALERQRAQERSSVLAVLIDAEHGTFRNVGAEDGKARLAAQQQIEVPLLGWLFHISKAVVLRGSLEQPEQGASLAITYAKGQTRKIVLHDERRDAESGMLTETTLELDADGEIIDFREVSTWYGRVVGRVEYGETSGAANLAHTRFSEMTTGIAQTQPGIAE